MKSKKPYCPPVRTVVQKSVRRTEISSTPATKKKNPVPAPKMPRGDVNPNYTEY
jgi:hypothetical protein